MDSGSGSDQQQQPETKVSLKLLVDTKSKRVLFAEAGKDFIDFLFSILTLPVGTVIRLLTNTPLVGSLGNVYNSVDHMNNAYMQTHHKNKDLLLNPKAPIDPSAVCPLLPGPDVSSLQTTRTIYKCLGRSITDCRSYCADDPLAICPSCNSNLNYVMKYVASPSQQQTKREAKIEGGFVKGLVTYMVMDDLVVKPMSTISCIALINQFGMTDLGVLKEEVVDMGMDEVVDLLRASLQSKTVLSDVFLRKSEADVKVCS